MAKLRSYAAGPRWAGLTEFLHKAAYECDVELTILYSEKGWLRHTISYTVEGKDENIEKFRYCLRSTQARYNSD